MPGKKRRNEWRELVFELTAQNPTWGPGRVIDKLSYMDEAKALLALDMKEDPEIGLPGARTVGRWQGEYRVLDDPSKSAYHTYSWPGAMHRAALPWEASAALFDLCRHRKRPVTIRRAQWFWRVTLACSDAPLARRDELAGLLAAADVLPEDARVATHETVEATISYAPWKSEEHQLSYTEAIGRGELKQLSLTLTADTTIDEAVEAVAEQMGSSIATSVRSIFEALAKHPELSPPEALAAEAKKGATE